MKLRFTHILSFLLLFLSGGILSAMPPEERNGDKSETCSTFMVIKGESNINRFSFSFASSPGNPESRINYNSSENGTEIHIPLREFQASNPHMYSDFLEELHASEYPYISILFPYLEPDKLGSLTSGSVQTVRITLAGVAKQYIVDCKMVNCGDHLVINGSEQVRLTDFRISPPEKLNGLIKVRNEITVNFGIILNFITDNTYADSR
jgi:hypothetical protein